MASCTGGASSRPSGRKWRSSDQQVQGRHMFTEMTFTSTDEERRTMYTASVERHEAVPRTPAARGGLATKSIRPSGWRARPLASPLSTGRGLASSGRGSLVTDQQWLEFFATQGLSCFVGKENFLPLFFEERR